MSTVPFVLNKFRVIIILTVIIIIASWLRLSNIEAITTFGGDQGYDFTQIRQVVVDKNPTLLGPKIGPYTNGKSLYLGPAYYYILLPSLVLANFDPIGPAILTSLVSIATIILIYLTCYKCLNPVIGLIAVAFYTFTPFLIYQSQAPSNPHLLPFFSILTIFAILDSKSHKRNTWLWPLIAGLSSGIAFQLHYLAVSLVIACIVFLFKSRLVIFSVLGFLISLSPQVIFELKHDFFVTNLIFEQIFSGHNTATLSKFFTNLILGFQIFSKAMVPNTLSPLFLVMAICICLIVLIKKDKRRSFLISLSAFVSLAALVLASLYSGQVHVHYLAVAYPAFAILISSTIYQLFNLSKNVIVRSVVITIVGIMFAQNILAIELKQSQGYTMPTGWNLPGIREAAKIIAKDANGDFNIANTLDGDTRAMPLRYLTDVYGKTPQPVENYSHDLSAVYVLSRDDNAKILQYTVWEVDNYKPFVISQDWHVQNGIRVVKLERL